MKPKQTHKVLTPEGIVFVDKATALKFQIEEGYPIWPVFRRNKIKKYQTK